MVGGDWGLGVGFSPPSGSCPFQERELPKNLWEKSMIFLRWLLQCLGIGVLVEVGFRCSDKELKHSLPSIQCSRMPARDNQW
jgi:hypothetical protein